MTLTVVRWDTVFAAEVDHWETTNGVLVNLESLVMALYPDTRKNTLARTTIAHDFMWRLQAERRRVKQERTAEKLRKQQEKD